MTPIALEGVPERLEWLRRYAGKTRSAFAADLYLVPAAYSNWVRGSQRLSLDAALRINQLYGAPLDFLYLGNEDGMPKKLKAAWRARPDADDGDE